MNRSQVIFKAIDIFAYIPQNMTRYKGIVNIKDAPFNEDCSIDASGDIYYHEESMKICKQENKKMPVILNIHGGGFVMGDKKFRKSYSSFWAKNGYFVFNINYRLAPEIQFPGYLKDSVDAINYIEVLNQYYEVLDLDRVVVMGDSSGGYSAAYLTALAFDDTLRETLGMPEIKVKPALLAPFCGIYDVQTLLGNNILPFKVVDITAATFLGYDKLKDGLENIKEYKYIDFISPLAFVNENWCPVFLAWSNSDIVCTNQGRPFYDKLCECIGEEKVGYFETSGFVNNHCFHLNMTTKASKLCLAAAKEFLGKKLNFEGFVFEENEKVAQEVAAE